MNARQATILIVEDDLPLAKLMATTLTREGYKPLIETRGDLAVERIRKENPDLVILDLMLPGEDGFAVCRQARAFYHGCIMMLTAREENVDQILGLELGADDYVIKPVMPRLLLARVRAHLRRTISASSTSQDNLTLGALTISGAQRRILLHGEELKLTTSEFDLLYFLARNAGRIISRQDLYKELRGIDYDGLDRSMDLRISKLRSRLRKLAPELNPIKTIHGKGYLFAQDSSKGVR